MIVEGLKTKKPVIKGGWYYETAKAWYYVSAGDRLQPCNLLGKVELIYLHRSTRGVMLGKGLYYMVKRVLSSMWNSIALSYTKHMVPSERILIIPSGMGQDDVDKLIELDLWLKQDTRTRST